MKIPTSDNRVHCGENDHDAFPKEQLSRGKQPALCYFDTMINWQHTGFFTYTRSDFETDTREEMLAVLAKHFSLA